MKIGAGSILGASVKRQKASQDYKYNIQTERAIQKAAGQKIAAVIKRKTQLPPSTLLPEKAATKIQTAIRKKQATKKVKEMLNTQDIQNIIVPSIQTAVRGRIARKKLQALREEKILLNAPGTKIAKVIKGASIRKSVKPLIDTYKKNISKIEKDKLIETTKVQDNIAYERAIISKNKVGVIGGLFTSKEDKDKKTQIINDAEKAIKVEEMALKNFEKKLDNKKKKEKEIFQQISSIANPATTAVIKKLSATKTEVAVAIGDLVVNGIYTFKRNSANDAWIVLELSNPATTTTQGIAFLSNPITISNNATDANNDIDFSAGNGVFDDGLGQVLLSSTLVKRLDATWSAGTGNGGLFNGTAVPKANSTLYYLFAITNGTITDAGFDTSSTGANIPAGYKGSYRGTVLTDGSGNIRAFTLAGQYMEYVSDITDYNPSPTSGVFATYALSCPRKANILAKVMLTLLYSGGGVVTLATSYRKTGSSANNLFFGGAINGYTAHASTNFVPLNSSAQIDFSFSFTAPASNFAVITKGYFDFNIKI